MNKPQHIAFSLNSFLDKLPEDQKKKYLIGKRVKQVQAQFAACVDPFILDHINSVYLVKDETSQTLSPKTAREEKALSHKESDEDVSRETFYNLTAYVDNSLIAAELNAQRELIVLKFRELFSVRITTFSIKISRGKYLNTYPYRIEEQEEKTFTHKLTREEEKEIEEKTSLISDPDIRASFQRVLKAFKEHPLEN